MTPLSGSLPGVAARGRCQGSLRGGDTRGRCQGSVTSEKESLDENAVRGIL